MPKPLLCFHSDLNVLLYGTVPQNPGESNARRNNGEEESLSKMPAVSILFKIAVCKELQQSAASSIIRTSKLELSCMPETLCKGGSACKAKGHHAQALNFASSQ